MFCDNCAADTKVDRTSRNWISYHSIWHPQEGIRYACGTQRVIRNRNFELLKALKIFPPIRYSVHTSSEMTSTASHGLTDTSDYGSSRCFFPVVNSTG